MRVPFLLSLFREDIVRALFWTLVHSLWQGLALAILTGLVILFTRRSAPVLRYNMLLGLLCLFIAGVGTTFCLALKGSALPSAAGSASPINFYVTDPTDTPVATTMFVSEPSLGQRLVGYFNQKANFIVAIWFIILSIHFIKLVANLGKVQRLRYYRTSPPEEYWRHRVTALAQRIGIKKQVEILESSLVRVPMMAGLLKPVILTPLGLLSQLPPQQVEAILLHELAHIRRKDYLVNLLQSLAEMLFFFNPAVLWISSLIREERENCCDDIAVGETRSKKEFIHALVSFQEYKPAVSSHALAFPGGKNQLLQRVKRIVNNDNKTLDIREKFFLLACLFITAGLTLAYTRHTPVADVPRPAATVRLTDPIKFHGLVHRATADTSKKPSAGKDTLLTEDEGRKWKGITEQQREAMMLQQERLNAARMELAEKDHELAVVLERLNEMIARARLDTLQADVQKHQARQLFEAQLRLENLRNQESLRLLQSEKLLDASRERLRSATRMQSERLLLDQQRLEMARQRLDRSSRGYREAVDSRSRILQPIIEMLSAKKLITSTDELSFSLDKDELIVNDKKQPDEVFQSFKEAFIHNSKDYVKYSKHGNSESSSINQDKD